jgi:WD40 repeat protein
VLRGHSKVVERVAWSRDERSILSPSFDRTLRLWSVETGECLRVVEGHGAGVKQVVYMGDESAAVSCDWSGEIRRWNLSPS